MAYDFSKIQSGLNGDDGEQQKANIFAPDAGQPQQSAAQQGQQAQGGAEKTSTEADLGSGNTQTPTGTVQQDQSQSAAANQNTARQAIQRNAGKTQNPQMFSRVQQQLGAAGKGLQDEADAYIKNAKNTKYDVGANDISNFVKGDADAAAKISKLNATGAVTADPFKAQTDLSLPDVDQLQTDAGLINAFRQQAGADYTTGMGAFDLAAARRTPGFDQLRASLAQQKSALQKQADEYATSKNAEAQKALEANLTSAKTGLKTGLQGAADKITAVDQAAADAANKAMKTGQGKYTADQAAAARKALLSKTDPGARLDDMIKNANVDASKYYTNKAASAKDMITAEQADQFNRIMAALGRSDPDSVYTAGSGAPKQAFDAKAYNDAVRQMALKQRAGTDLGLQLQINGLNTLFQNRYDPAAEKAAEVAAVQNDLRSQYGDVFDQVDANSDPYSTGATWKDQLTSDDIAKLSPLYRQLGQTTNIPQAGQYVGVGGFDADRYRADLSQALAAKQQANKEAELAAQKAEQQKAAQEKSDPMKASNMKTGGTFNKDNNAPLMSPGLKSDFDFIKSELPDDEPGKAISKYVPVPNFL